MKSLNNNNEYPSGLPLDSLAATFHQQSQVHVFYNCFVWPLSLRSWVIIALISILSFAYEQLAPLNSFLKGDVYAVMAGVIFTFLSAHVYYHFKFGGQVTIQKDRLIFSEYWVNKGKPKALNFDSIKFIIVEWSNYRWLFKADKAWWRAHFIMVMVMVMVKYSPFLFLIFYLYLHLSHT